MDKQYRCSLSRLLFSYWKGEEKKRAWGMAITIAALTVAAVYMTLLDDGKISGPVDSR